MKHLFIASLLLLSVGCAKQSDAPETTEAPPVETETPAQEPAADSGDRLADILATQPDEAKARYEFRNPQATLEFIGIEPGMTVVEALPGGGWYTKVLLPYLGSDGHLIGVDYASDMWKEFSFYSDELGEAKKTWKADWTTEANGWRSDDSASVSAQIFGGVPESETATADAVLMIRALHNLARFETKGGYLSQALSDAHRMLKPGGVLGIVQHEAPDSKADEWADGSRGYLKKSAVIDAVTNAGFEYVGSSTINENPKDQPGDEDIVWRLAPSFATSRENEELKAELTPIGESNRMTLKFVKPE
ncbi:MAG: methyltransferase [Pseudomonadota bacterium]